MTETSEKVRSLVAESSELANALSVVLSRAGYTSNEKEDGDGSDAHTVTWKDVSDELTSGQWGRLIERGILYDKDGTGFGVSEPEEIKNTLNQDEVITNDGESDGNSEWTIYDKLAGLGAVALFPSYFIGPIRNIVGNTADIILGPFDAVLPFYSVIIVLSVLTGLYSVLFQSNLMDTDKMGELQERMSDIQQRQKEARERGDDAAVERIQEEQMEAMGDQLGMFKLMFRPMVWIMLVTIPALVWMYWKLGIRGGTEHIVPAERVLVLPIVGQMELTEKIGGLAPVWLLWYFICSISFRMVIQKTLDLETSPSQ